MGHRSSNSAHGDDAGRQLPPRYLLHAAPATHVCRAILTVSCIACVLTLGGCNADGDAGADVDRAAASNAEPADVVSGIIGSGAADAASGDSDVAARDFTRSLLDGMVAVATGTGECVALTEKARRRAASPGKAVSEQDTISGELPRIELVPGLTVIRAVVRRDREDESTVEVTGVDDDGITLSRVSTDGSIDRRRVLRQDLDHAGCMAFNYTGEPGIRGPGLTWLSLSRALLAELRDVGEAEFGVANERGPQSGFVTWVGSIRRVGTGTYTLMLDDTMVALPSIAVHAEVRHGGAVKEFDLEFLDDPSLPLLLKACCVRSADHAVRIERRGTDRIERALAETGRVIVYGIRFDFGSADLRGDAEPVLAEIADVLRRNADWRVRIEGHTDSIGDAQSNLELSQRRAETVMGDLVNRLGPDAAGRIATGGHGESRPRADNGTVAGRAANRRVELIRSNS